MNITYTSVKTKEKHHVLFCQDNVALSNYFRFFFLNLVGKERHLNCSF